MYAITNLVDSAAITRSAAPTKPIPAPAALPCTAAMTGASSRTSCDTAAWSGVVISRQVVPKAVAQGCEMLHVAAAAEPRPVPA